MANIHIVTDSGAHFANPRFVQQFPVTIVPNKVIIDGKTYREGVDLAHEEALKLIEYHKTTPQVQAPTQAEYYAVYEQLVRRSSGIISIHPSRQLSTSWHHAMAAARELTGHCPIEVIDSRAISAGQGMLVRSAVREMDAAESFDGFVRTLRGAISRIYSVYYVETIDYLLQNNVMTSSHVVLGSMLGIKPILTMDDGLLKPMEKVKTRTQAIDRMVEFVSEFDGIEDAAILQNRNFMTEQARILQDRLAVEFPGQYFPHTIYGPSLAGLIGPDATGLVVLENEADVIGDSLDD
ncbi:MAG: DegV family protein [Chloroflexi bacterium]|nr:MAG: DegV family protein [Chloroflexota bacterium]